MFESKAGWHVSVSLLYHRHIITALEYKDSNLQILWVAPEAALARGTLNVDVLVHALDMADCGVDAWGDGVDLHIDGVKASIQRGETLTSAVLVVPGGCKNNTLEASIDQALMQPFLLV